MKEKIEELIKAYEKEIEYFENIDHKDSDFHYLNLGILVACDETIRNLKGLLEYLKTEETEKK